MVRKKSLMAKWLAQMPQWHERYCHDLEVVSSNPCRVELRVCSTSVLSHTWTKNTFCRLINRTIICISCCNAFIYQKNMHTAVFFNSISVYTCFHPHQYDVILGFQCAYICNTYAWDLDVQKHARMFVYLFTALLLLSFFLFVSLFVCLLLWVYN